MRKPPSQCCSRFPETHAHDLMGCFALLPLCRFASLPAFFLPSRLHPLLLPVQETSPAPAQPRDLSATQAMHSQLLRILGRKADKQPIANPTDPNPLSRGLGLCHQNRTGLFGTWARWAEHGAVSPHLDLKRRPRIQERCRKTSS